MRVTPEFLATILSGTSILGVGGAIPLGKKEFFAELGNILFFAV